MLDWSNGVYNPLVDITQDTTTLYASDRDVFLFLVDDLNPIEAGRLPDGSPDLYFRGFSAGIRRWARRRSHGELLPSGRLPEPQSLGRRGLRGNRHPPLEVRGLPLHA